MLNAAPKVKKVRHGKVTTSRHGQKTTYRTGDKAIIDFHSFDVSKGESVRFQQSGKNSRVLGRIGGKASKIDGAISANGKLYLLNPAGFVFGPTATIQAHHFYAAAGSMSDRDFLSSTDRFFDLKGRVQFDGVLSAEGVGLFGKDVAVNGKILVPVGMVLIQSGDNVLIGQEDGHLFVKLKRGQGEEGIGASDLFAASLGPDSEIIAHDVLIEAEHVECKGKIDVSSKAQAGNVSVIADKIVCYPDSVIEAEGDSGGIIALKAKDHLNYSGTYLARGDTVGGRVETCSKGEITTFEAPQICTEARTGDQHGLWLFDPEIVDLSTNTLWTASGFGTASGAVIVTADGANPQVIFGNGGAAADGLVTADFASASSVLIETVNGATPAGTGLVTINGCTVTSTAAAPIIIDTAQINFDGTTTTGTANTTGGLTCRSSAPVDSLTMTVQNMGTLSLSNALYTNLISLSLSNSLGNASTDLNFGSGGSDPIFNFITGASMAVTGGTVIARNLIFNLPTFSTSGSATLTANGDLTFDTSSSTSLLDTTTTATGNLSIPGTSPSFQASASPVTCDGSATIATPNLTVINSTINSDLGCNITSPTAVVRDGSDVGSSGTGALLITSTTLTIAGSGGATLRGTGVTIDNNIRGNAERVSPLVIEANGGDVVIGASFTTVDRTIGTGFSLASVTINDPNNFNVNGSIFAGGFTLTNGTGNATFNANQPNPFTVVAGLVTTGNIDTAFPLLSSVPPSDGGNISITTDGSVAFEAPFYFIDASGGSAVSSSDTAHLGGDVTITSTSGNILVNAITTQAGMPVVSPTNQTDVVGGNIDLVAMSGTVTVTNKLLSTRLPILEGSGTFGSGGAITVDATQLILQKDTVNVNSTSPNYPDVLQSWLPGVVLNATFTGNTISVPETVIEGGVAADFIPIYSYVSESIGASEVTGDYGTVSTPAGNLLVSYANDFTLDQQAFVSSLTQIQGLGTTLLTDAVESNGKVSINNSGTIITNGITTTDADISLQPAVTFTTGPQGNIPDGFLEILDDIDAGTGDIFFSSEPRGDNISVATIYNDAANPITITGNSLETGDNEVVTAFDDLSINTTESSKTGDLVAIGNIDITAPTIEFISHPTYDILINTGGFISNPSGGHIVSGGTVTTSTTPSLTGGGTLLTEQSVTISQALLTFGGSTISNFLTSAAPPPPPPPEPSTTNVSPPPIPPFPSFPPSDFVTTTNLGLTFYSPIFYFDIQRLALLGEITDIDGEVEAICQGAAKGSCELQVEWDGIKQRISQNKYALDRATKLYMRTHSGEFVVEDYLNAVDQNLRNFLGELAEFQGLVDNNYPKKADVINGPLNEFVKPDGFSGNEWKKILGFF